MSWCALRLCARPAGEERAASLDIDIALLLAWISENVVRPCARGATAAQRELVAASFVVIGDLFYISASEQSVDVACAWLGVLSDQLEQSPACTVLSTALLIATCRAARILADAHQGQCSSYHVALAELLSSVESRVVSKDDLAVLRSGLTICQSRL